jgi:hypothetical protein
MNLQDNLILEESKINLENDFNESQEKDSGENEHRDTQLAELLKISTTFAISDNTEGGEEKSNTLFPFKKSVENIVLIYNTAKCEYEES